MPVRSRRTPVGADGGSARTGMWPVRCIPTRRGPTAGQRGSGRRGLRPRSERGHSAACGWAGPGCGGVVTRPALLPSVTHLPTHPRLCVTPSPALRSYSPTTRGVAPTVQPSDRPAHLQSCLIEPDPSLSSPRPDQAGQIQAVSDAQSNDPLLPNNTAGQ